MKYSFFLLISFVVTTVSSCQQTKKNPVTNAKEIKVGGGCEGCEAIYESPIPFEQLSAVDTLPDFNEPGPKIEISGTVYKADGKTPAPDVILYVYHTDQTGVYGKKESQTGWGKRHGYIRGWIKTDAKGSYKFYTLVPASYPTGDNPKHIHPVIKEPGFSEYWIDEYLFDDDPLIPARERTKTDPVGSFGVLKPVMRDGMLRATRDIILGSNVRDYPR